MSLPPNLQQKLLSLKDSIVQFMKLHNNPYDTSSYNELAKKLEQLEQLLSTYVKGNSDEKAGPANDSTTANDGKAGPKNNSTPVPPKKKMLYEDLALSKHGQAFVDAIRTIGGKLGLKPDYIMATMKAECGFNHKAINPKSGASGLIQFMPATAIGLGTTVKAIRKMSAMKQLVYVEKYYKSHKKLIVKMTEPAESYLLVFYPYAIGKPDSYVLGSQKSDKMARKIASQNKIYDLNKDGYVTKGEIMEYMRKHKYKDAYKQLDDSAPASGDTYVVQSGETLEAIAKKLGVTVEALKSANADKIQKWGKVEGFNAGVTITVPSKGSTGTAGEPKDEDASTDATPKSPGTYVVQEGETLEVIAAKMKTTVELLKQHNQDKLKKWGKVEGFNVTEVVTVPPGGIVPNSSSNGTSTGDNSGNTGTAGEPKDEDASTDATPKSPGTYVVQEGETLEVIAAKMKTTVELLKQHNQDKLKKWGKVEGFNVTEVVIVPPGGIVPKAASNSGTTAGDIDDNSGNTGIGDSGDEVYKNQRDNPRYGDTTCNVTTLAMQLIALASGDEERVKKSAVQLLQGYGQRASTSTQLEELLRLLTIKVAGKKIMSGVPAWQWSWVLDKTGEKFKDIVSKVINPDEGGLYNIYTKEKYDAKIVPELKKGAEVMLSNKLTKGGHIVFLVAVRADGLVIHDPYGIMVANHRYIKNSVAIMNAKGLYNRNPKTIASRLKLNTNLKAKLDETFTKGKGALPSNMGESNFYTWDEVATYKIGKWCNIAYKA